MLDPRSAVSTPKAEMGPVRAKVANMSDALAARELSQQALSFGSVLSDAMSTHKAALPSRREAAEAEASAPSRPAGRRKNTSPDRRTNGEKDAAVDASSAQSTPAAEAAAAPADEQKKQEAATPEAEPVTAESPPPPSDAAATADGTKPSAATGADGGTAGQEMAQIMAAAEAVAAGQTDPAGQAAGTAGSGSEVSGTVRSEPAKLPWMAQQRVAEVTARMMEQRAAAVAEATQQGNAGDANAEASGAGKGAVGAAIAAGKQAGLTDAKPAVQELMANLLGTVRPSSGVFDMLKEPREKTSDPQAASPAGAIRAPESPTIVHSVTSDPVSLLSPASSFAGASPAAHMPPPVAHVATAPAAESGMFVPADDTAAQNVQRLTTMVHAAMGRQQSVARMQLQPPELGAVTAVLQMRQNKMELKLEVASEAAKDVLNDGLGRLRASLQQQGISLDRATVSVAPRGEQATGDQQQQQSHWAGQQGHGSGQFHPGPGGQQGDRSLATSFAMDVPAGMVAAEADAPGAVAAYAAGLNVLA